MRLLARLLLASFTLLARRKTSLGLSLDDGRGRSERGWADHNAKDEGPLPDVMR